MPSPIFTSGVENDPSLYYNKDGQYTKISNPTELQTLAQSGVVEVGKPYQTLPNGDITPTPTSPTAPTQPIEAPKLGDSPTTFKASSLMDFYTNQMDYMKSQMEAAQKSLADNQKALSEMTPPDYTKKYNDLFASKVEPMNASMTDVNNQMNTVNDALRNLEDDTRKELGGTAAESVVQAELARRAKPLILRAQALQDRYNALDTQRNQAISAIHDALGLDKDTFQAKLDTYKNNIDLGQKVVDAYNSLSEKGANASDKEKDNARELFKSFLEQAPDVLKSFSQEEYDALSKGVIPYTVMQKISSTIDQQKLQAQKEKSRLVGSAATGFYAVDSNNIPRLIIPPNSTMNPSQRIQAASNLMAASPLNYPTMNDALEEVDRVSSTSTESTNYNSSSGQNIPQRNNNPLNITLGASTQKWVDQGVATVDKNTNGFTYLKFTNPADGFKAAEDLLRSGAYSNLTVDAALRKWSGNGYGAEAAPAVPANAKIKDLSAEQMNQLIGAMANREGFYAGTSQTQSTDSKAEDIKQRAIVASQSLKTENDKKIFLQNVGSLLSAGKYDEAEKAISSGTEASQLKTDALNAAKDLLTMFNGSSGLFGSKFAVGTSSILPVPPGTQAANFVNLYNNFKALLSLDSVKYLKGQGQISDSERTLLADAASLLNRSQSEEEFVKTLENIVAALSGNSQETVTSSATSTGSSYTSSSGKIYQLPY